MLLRFRDIPNLITVARILMVAPLLWFVLEGSYSEALILFFIAGLSDGVDGFLAKHYGWTSRLGGILDPVADKLLLVSTALALAWRGDLPIWLVSLFILRDAIIVLGAVSYHYLIEPLEAAPLAISKLNTLFQLVLVLAVLIDRGVLSLPDNVLMLLIYISTLTTTASGIAYVWKWSRMAWRKGRHVHAE